MSIGTIRTIYVLNGRRGTAWVLGFVEVLIWVLAVSKVIANLNQPLYAVAFALGFATGNYTGMTVERWIALGEQIVRVFTRRGPDMAAALRAAGFRVTQFDGHGRDGPVYLLLTQTRRRDVERVVDRARALDPSCFYVIDDVRAASRAPAGAEGGWREVVKKE